MATSAAEVELVKLRAAVDRQQMLLPLAAVLQLSPPSPLCCKGLGLLGDLLREVVQLGYVAMNSAELMALKLRCLCHSAGTLLATVLAKCPAAGPVGTVGAAPAAPRTTPEKKRWEQRARQERERSPPIWEKDAREEWQATQHIDATVTPQRSTAGCEYSTRAGRVARMTASG